jgi:hypothetical protein
MQPPLCSEGSAKRTHECAEYLQGCKHGKIPEGVQFHVVYFIIVQTPIKRKHHQGEATASARIVAGKGASRLTGQSALWVWPTALLKWELRCKITVLLKWELRCKITVFV